MCFILAVNLAQHTLKSSFFSLQRSFFPPFFQHWFQVVACDRFQQYDDNQDFTKEGYRAFLPQAYPVSQIKCPMAVFYGGADKLTDIPWLLRELPVGSKTFCVDAYEHLDPLWAADAKDKVCSFGEVGGKRRRGDICLHQCTHACLHACLHSVCAVSALCCAYRDYFLLLGNMVYRAYKGELCGRDCDGLWILKKRLRLRPKKAPEWPRSLHRGWLKEWSASPPLLHLTSPSSSHNTTAIFKVFPLVVSLINSANRKAHMMALKK